MKACGRQCSEPLPKLHGNRVLFDQAKTHNKSALAHFILACFFTVYADPNELNTLPDNAVAYMLVDLRGHLCSYRSVQWVGSSIGIKVEAFMRSRRP